MEKDMKNIIKRISIVLFVILLCLNIVSGQGKTKEVTVTGEAAGDSLQAYDEALKDALRKAVEMGVGVFVSGDTYTKNFELISDKIFSQARGYIEDYEVISKIVEDGMYKVTIRATVSTKKIESTLRDLNILKDILGYPRLMVIGFEKIDGELSDGASAQTQIERVFLDKGFDMVDKFTVEEIKERDFKINQVDNINLAATLGKKYGAEVVLIVNAFADFQQDVEEYGVNIRFYNGNVQAKIVDADTGKLLGTESITEMGRARDSLERAGKKIAPKLMEKVVKVWRERGYGSGNEVEIVVSEISYPSFMKLKKEIEKIRGVESTSNPSFTKNVGALRVKGTIQADDMAVKLSELKTVRLEITGVTQNRIDIKYSE